MTFSLRRGELDFGMMIFRCFEPHLMILVGVGVDDSYVPAAPAKLLLERFTAISLAFHRLCMAMTYLVPFTMGRTRRSMQVWPPNFSHTHATLWKLKTHTVWASQVRNVRKVGMDFGCQEGMSRTNYQPWSQWKVSLLSKKYLLGKFLSDGKFAWPNQLITIVQFKTWTVRGNIFISKIWYTVLSLHKPKANSWCMV